MTSFGDFRDSPADVMAVLEDGVTVANVFESDFVSERDSIDGFKRDGFVAFHDPTGQVGIRGSVFNYHDANGHLPFGSTNNSAHTLRQTWVMYVWPYVEQDNFYKNWISD